MNDAKTRGCFYNADENAGFKQGTSKPDRRLSKHSLDDATECLSSRVANISLNDNNQEQPISTLRYSESFANINSSFCSLLSKIMLFFFRCQKEY